LNYPAGPKSMHGKSLGTSQPLMCANAQNTMACRAMANRGEPGRLQYNSNRGHETPARQTSRVAAVWLCYYDHHPYSGVRTYYLRPASTVGPGHRSKVYYGERLLLLEHDYDIWQYFGEPSTAKRSMQHISEQAKNEDGARYLDNRGL